MALLSKLEYEKRIRNVQEWIVEDFLTCDIISNIVNQWGISERQAQRYIKEARKRWGAEEDVVIEQKRKQRVLKLKKLARSLKEPYKGTPDGIRAIMMVESKIIKLENLEPAKKVELSGVNGKPIQTQNIPSKIDYKQLPDEVLRALISARKK